MDHNEFPDDSPLMATAGSVKSRREMNSLDLAYELVKENLDLVGVDFPSSVRTKAEMYTMRLRRGFQPLTYMNPVLLAFVLLISANEKEKYDDSDIRPHPSFLENEYFKKHLLHTLSKTSIPMDMDSLRKNVITYYDCVQSILDA